MSQQYPAAKLWYSGVAVKVQSRDQTMWASLCRVAGERVGKPFHNWIVILGRLGWGGRGGSILRRCTWRSSWKQRVWKDLTYLMHMFNPKPCIDFQLGKAFWISNFEDDTRKERWDRANTSICLLLLRSKWESWGKKGKSTLKLCIQQNTLVAPMALHPGGRNWGVGVNCVRPMIRAVFQERAASHGLDQACI